MADLLFLGITVAFFALAVAYVRLCDRIIGPDPAGGENTAAEPDVGTDELIGG